MSGNSLKEVIEIIKFSSEEAQEYEDTNEFTRGVAFAYRCVWSLLKDLEEWLYEIIRHYRFYSKSNNNDGTFIYRIILWKYGLCNYCFIDRNFM